MRLAKAVEAGSDPERLHLENVVEANNKTIQQLRLQLESFHKQPNKVCPPLLPRTSFTNFILVLICSQGNTDNVKQLQEKMTELSTENERLREKNEEVTANHKTLLAELRSTQQTLEGLKGDKRSPQINHRYFFFFHLLFFLFS